MKGEEERKFEYFPRLALYIIHLLFRDPRMEALYIQWMSLINYAIVCGIGVGINMIVIHALVKIFPLWLANLGAIFTAFLWNWSMSVGPYGYLWGLSEKKKDVTIISHEFWKEKGRTKSEIREMRQDEGREGKGG